MNEKTMRLDSFIQLMRKSYPRYVYINVINDKSADSMFTDSKYSIIVKNIPRASFKSFMAFVKEKILMPCIDNNEELPSVIPIQEKNTCLYWQNINFRDRQPLVLNNIPQYEYALAA